METTIQISEDLLEELKKRKINEKSYEDVIWDLIEDELELSEETKKTKKEIFVKIDGNRRIIIEPLKNNREVNARIDDLRYSID